MNYLDLPEISDEGGTSRYLNEIENDYTLYPRNKEVKTLCTVTVKCEMDELENYVMGVLKCFMHPYMVYIDCYALADNIWLHE